MSLTKVGTPSKPGCNSPICFPPSKFDAAFCTEDMVAVGMLHGMLKKGVRVGQDFGLVGFDNIHIGQQVFPELTTIDQNIFEKGETATKTLLKILKKKSSLGSRLILPVSLVARETA